MSQQTLKDAVTHCVENYFKDLNGTTPADMYKMVTQEVEAALFHSVLKHTENNQCRASEYLGMNRGTLRKKLKEHGLI